jgi:hypothetical protein
VYWESLGVGSDPDGDDGRGIATELPVSYIFDKLKREIEALGMENNLKLNLHTSFARLASARLGMHRQIERQAYPSTVER